MFDPDSQVAVRRAHRALMAAAAQLPRLEQLVVPGELLRPGELRSDVELPAFNAILLAAPGRRAAAARRRCARC